MKQTLKISSPAPSSPGSGSQATAGRAASEATLSVTERAYRRVEVLLEREGHPAGALRVGVKGGGCAGYSYTLKLEPAGSGPGDVVMSSGNARIYVDPKSARLLAGTVLDFTDGLDGKGFTFENPNAKRTCGCGHSFST